MEKKLSTFFIFLLLIPTLFCVIVADAMIYGFIKNHFANRADELEVSNSSVILGETDDQGQEYIDKIIFLGESTTYGLQSYGILSDGVDTAQVWTGAKSSKGVVESAGTLSLSPGIEGTVIYYPDTGTALTISEAVKAKSPEIMIITLGLNNGASYYSEKTFKDCYGMLIELVKDASADTEIILQSIFPVSRSCKIRAFTPERISLCNEWIYDVAKEHGLKYLNTAEQLSDNCGYLKDEYDNGGDGIHLNREGLLAVIEYIRTHGVTKEAA